MVKVLTVGTFDTPHSGHINLFAKCRKLADLEPYPNYNRRVELGVTQGRGEVIVGINSDQFVFKYKGAFPAYPYEERAAIIDALSDVDEVIMNHEDSMQGLLARVSPDFLIVGSDWAKKDYYSQIGVTQQWLDEYNITLLYVPYTEGISSTQLKERISSL